MASHHGTDAAAVKQRLLGDLDRFLPTLFPSGKVHGHEFRVGSLSGEAGQSLVVELRGPKAGLWVDRNGQTEYGDIYQLASKVWGLEFRETLARCCEFLGITNVEKPLAKPKPAPPDRSFMGRMLGTTIHDYLGEWRRLSDEVMKRYRLRSYARQSEFNTEHVAFSFHAPEGELLWIKTLGFNRKPDGKKDIWSTPPWWTLWGWWLVKSHHRAIIITEGEIDAMSVAMMLESDIPVLSVPNGTNGCDWIENDFEALRQFEIVYILTDADPAGEDCAKEIARRLGRTRCKRVDYPAGFKDGNEVLCKGDDVHMHVEQWLENARTYDPAALVRVNELAGELNALRVRQRQAAAVNDFIWPKFDFQFRDGETTIFSGYPESGKSTLLYQTHLHEMRQGRICLLISFEINPEEMLNALIKLMGVPDDAGTEDMMAALHWLNDRLVFVRPPDPYPFETMAEDIRYAVQRYGVRRVAIDSMHYLAAKDDYEEQDSVARKIHRLGKELLTHNALVAHSPKVKDMTHIPGMMEVEGSGGIIKPVDNVIVCHRNIAKEEALTKAREAEDQTKLDAAMKMPDGTLVVRKQRLTGRHPLLRLYHGGDLGFRLTIEEEKPEGVPPPANGQIEF